MQFDPISLQGPPPEFSQVYCIRSRNIANECPIQDDYKTKSLQLKRDSRTKNYSVDPNERVLRCEPGVVNRCLGDHRHCVVLFLYKSVNRLNIFIRIQVWMIGEF